MAYLNVDLDYFTHPKTMRLVGLLGKDSAVMPILLWCYCGKHHCENGRLAGYSPQEIESIVGWRGKPGEMIGAMIRVGFLLKLDDGFEIKDWLDHQGHLSMFKKRAKDAAKKRWGIKDDATSNTKGNAKDEVKQSPVPTVPTVPTVPIKTYVDFEQSTLSEWNSFCLKHPILPKIKELSGKRKIHLKKRFEIESFRNFKDILDAIEKQPFCLGKNDRNWRVSFDWLIENDTNYLKILESKYQDKIFAKEESKFKPVNPDCSICAGTGFVYVPHESGSKICSCRTK